MSFIFTTNSTTAPPRKEKVSDWAGTKKSNSVIHANSTSQMQQQQQEDDWKNVHSNIKQMDQFYDATFYAWLKSEENVLVTSIYLHRIANEYPLERIINALEWLTNDWRWESTSILVRHMTVDWCDDEGDIKRANLLKHLTGQWATHYIATLISTILMSSPYSNCSVKKRERFLREFTEDWDFSRLSEFFMFLRSRANIDYKFKCIMLQEAARKDVLMNTASKSDVTATPTSAPSFAINSTTPTTPINTTSPTTQHHRRTSSNDYQDMKRTILEETNEEPFSKCYPPPFSSNASSSGTASSSAASTTTSRYHHARLSTYSSTLTMTVASSSSNSNNSNAAAVSPDNLIPSASSSTTNNSNNEKKRITVI